MLSRTAENIFWMARYIERAESTARLIQMGQRMTILPGPIHREEWRSVLQVSGSDGLVSGEVYRVSDAQLARLDAVEDMVAGDRAASQYWRERVQVRDGALAGQQVWTYVYNRPVDGLTPITHGDYRRYIREVGRDS